jgi:hypothetical protein
MTNQLPPELFPQRPVRSEFTMARSYRVRRIMTCAVLIASMCGMGYGLYAWTRPPAEIPTIKAEGPLKQKPEQPGGIDVPNQDVLAYQQIDNSANKAPPVEHLLPPPETPQAAAVPPPVPTPAPAPTVETLLAPPAPPPVQTTVMPDKPKVKADANMAPAPQAAPRSAVIQASADGASAALPPPPAPAAEGVTAPSADAAVTPSAETSPPAANAEKPGKKGFRIQLASFPDEDTARQQMAHMEKKFSAQLGDAKLHLARADLGPRGIYYRVQSNPITDTEARDICGALAKLKAGCIVVKP